MSYNILEYRDELEEYITLHREKRKMVEDGSIFWFASISCFYELSNIEYRDDLIE